MVENSKCCKRIVWRVLAALLLTAASWSAGCGKTENDSRSRISRAADLNSGTCIVAGEVRTFALAVAEKNFPQAKIHNFNSCADIYPALAAGKIDAVVFDRPALEYAALHNPDFMVLPEKLADGMICVGAPPQKTELIRKVNEFIRQYRNDGTYQEMFQRWVRTKNPVMPEIPEPKNPEGILKVGSDCVNVPMAFLDSNKRLIGFDVEFSRRLALYLNLKCEFKLMDYEALLPACTAGTIDLAVANLDATEERSEKILYSDLYLDSPVAVMIRRQDFAAAALPQAFSPLNAPGKKIGVPQGAAAMTVGEKLFDRAKILYFSSLADGYAAVKYQKIDAFVFDRHTMAYAANTNTELKLLPEDLAEEHIVIGVAKKHPELRAQINQFIREYRKNGVYAEMRKRWLESTSHQMPDIPPPAAPTRKFRVGTEGMAEPMNYFDRNGKVTGFDVELIRRLAVFLQAEIEIETMTYPALIAAAETGKLDFMVANLNKSPEREQNLLLTDDYVDSAIAVMVHADFQDRTHEAVAPEAIRSLKDLQGKKAASLTGSGFQELTAPLQTGIEYVFFNDNHSSVAALRTGKVDAVLLDKPIAQMYAARFPEDIRFVEVYAQDYYGFAFRKGSPLQEAASRVIRELKQSGELARITEKWCTGNDSKKQLANWTHRQDFTGNGGTLRYASDMTQEPVCYTDADGKPIGLDVEIMRRIAYELNMKFEFFPMNFGSLIEALLSEKTDAVGGSMSITEERKKRVDFAECYYEGGLSILAQRTRKDRPETLADLRGKRIGILSGTTMDRAVAEHFPGSQPIYHQNFTDLPVALDAGKIDAFLLEEPQFRLLARSRPNLTALPQKLSSDDYAFLFARQNELLCAAFSTQIRALKADGTLKKLDEKWFSGDEEQFTLPPPLSNPPGGVLRFGTVPQLAPFSFMKDGKIVGYDIEVAQLAAARLGYALEPVAMEWSSLIEAVSAGKVSMGGGCITVTEERRQKVCFSEPDYQGGLVVIVPKAGFAEKKSGARNYFAACAQSLQESFERTFLREDRWKLVLDGLKVTVLITVLAAILGTLLAFPICFMRRSKRYLPRTLGKLFIALMQGTPILVILMILYYVIFAKIDLHAVVVAVIGFGLNFAAYAGEMLRTGIDSVPRGQREAALALGFSRFKTFFKVIFPQALRQILPVYRGEFINMLKTTSIVGYIAIQDLTKMSDIIRSRTYEAFFPLIATAVIYFATAWFLALGLTFLEHRLDPLSRRKSGKKENR